MSEFKDGDIIGGRYRIEESLGKGGMGTVYRAWDKELERRVALKVILSKHAQDPQYVQRFITEARAVAAIEHPNVMRIYDFPRDGAMRFIVSQFLEGETWQARLRGCQACNTLPTLGEILRLALDVCHGLQQAHARNLIHRDIKPSNLMLTPDGATVIMDFGVAKQLGAETLTELGQLLGTPRYIAPEQADAKHPVGPYTDLYSLGVALFELATGRCPFEADTLPALVWQHRNAPPPSVCDLNPDIPTSFAAIIERALAKEPADRFPHAQEMAAALSSFVRQVPTLPAFPRPTARDEATVTLIDPEVTRLPDTLASTVLPGQARAIRYDYTQQELRLQRLLDEHGALFQSETAQQALGRGFAAHMRQRLDDVLGVLTGEFSVVVLGAFNRGKSTLINALLGAQVVTTDILPETVTINQIVYGEAFTVTAHLPDGGRLELRPGELKSARLQTILEQLPQPPTHLQVSYPARWLQGVKLVDTPGLGDLFGGFDALVQGYLQRADTVLYVIMAQSPLAASERAFLQMALQPYELSKVCFVVNRLDALASAAESEMIVNAVKNKLAPLFPNAPVFGLSAKQEYCRRTAAPLPQPARAEEFAGCFQAFEKYLREAVMAQRRAIHLERALVRAAQALQESSTGIERVRAAHAAGQERVEQIIAACEDQNSALHQSIRQHRERVFTAINAYGEEAVMWLGQFLERLQQEVLSKLTRSDYETLQRHFSFFLADKVRDALRACFAAHQIEILQQLGLDAAIVTDIHQQLGSEESATQLAGAVRAAGSDAGGWTAWDSAHLALGGFSGVIGKILLGLAEKKSGAADKAERYQRELLRALPELRRELTEAVRQRYTAIASEVAQSLATAYQKQIEAALLSLTQARELHQSGSANLAALSDFWDTAQAGIAQQQEGLRDLRQQLEEAQQVVYLAPDGL